MWACCCTGQVDKWLLFLERAGLDVALHKEVVPIYHHLAAGQPGLPAAAWWNEAFLAALSTLVIDHVLFLQQGCALAALPGESWA